MSPVADAAVQSESAAAAARHIPQPRGPQPSGVLTRQANRESSARTYARSFPIVPVRAEGMTVEGADGRRYLDCLSGAGTLALGHNHPVVLEAIQRALDSGAPLHVLDLATPEKDAFTDDAASRRCRRRSPTGARLHFCGPAGDRRGGGRAQADADGDRAARGARVHRRVPRHDGGRAGASPATSPSASPAGRRRGGERDAAAVPVRLPLPVRRRRRARAERIAATYAERLLDDPAAASAPPAAMILEAGAGRGRGGPGAGRVAARDAAHHRRARHPADRGRGADRGRAHRRLLGRRAQRRSCPT